MLILFSLSSVRSQVIDPTDPGGSCEAVAYCYSCIGQPNNCRWEQTGTVKCTGAEECAAGFGYVICDGKRSNCIS